MPGRLACGLLAIGSALFGAGCGDRAGSGGATGRKVAFVGFDAGPPLVAALRRGKIQGLVLQNPVRMGELGVRTLVDHLEGKAVEPKVSTGETLATPENMDTPEVKALLEPAQAENRADAGAGGEKKWKVMVIPKGTTHEFWKSVHAGALQGAEALGNVEVIWQGPVKEDDRTDQINLVRSAVASDIDGIVLAPLDARALVEPVEQAIEKGIPVVIFDSGLDSTRPVAYVATDNYHGGVLGARRLGELLGGKGRIILLRYAVGSASTEEREEGFTDTIAGEFPGITYLSDDQYAGATAAQAQQVAQNLVTRHRGQIDGIFCVNESSTLGMLRALEGAGLLAARP